MACGGHNLQSETKAAEDDGFESFAQARAALLKELMSQVKRDRKERGQACSDFDDCEKGKRCATELAETHSFDALIYAYEDENDDLAYGYAWVGGTIDSGCGCVRKKKKKRR